MTIPISVVHIITKLELGGAQQVALFTVSHLDTSRFRPILVIGESGYLDAEAKAMPDIECYQVSSMVRPIRPFQDILALHQLTKLLTLLRPMIVHTHSSKAGILGRWAARLSGVPIIVHTIHGFGFTPYQQPAVRRLLIALERSTARFTTRFFVVSEANRRMGINLGLFSAESSSLLRPGIDISTFRQVRVDAAAKKRELGVGPEQPLIGMIAPFKPQKAPLDFVR
ncbi:MAG: glycosyltransferase family 1 protein, partial [Nitrospiraceae bacterium]